MLAPPSHSCAICFNGDASSTRSGAVLQQRVENSWQPLSFFSRKLSKAELNYSTYDRELLAAYFGRENISVTCWRVRPLRCILIIKPLTYAFRARNDNARLDK